MYCYTLSREIDIEVFEKYCIKIEKFCRGWKKEVLIDVDGSLYYHYRNADQHIKLYLDCEVDADYVESTIDLSSVLGDVLWAYIK